MQVTQDLIQAQVERTERARSAILAGKFLVTRTSPQQWTVKKWRQVTLCRFIETLTE